MGAHLDDISERHPWWDRKSIADLLGSIGESRCVRQNDEGTAAGIPCTRQKLIPERIFGRMIKLKPEVSIGDFADGFDACGAHGRKAERDVMIH